MTGQLPAFLGIGALKAGTSYLDQVLRSHPRLNLPHRLKETEFFTRHYDRGFDWYADQFLPGDGLRGEVSPQYVASSQAASRIHAANPEVRLLLTLRDPVDRVVSQYRHFAQETNFRGDLTDFCRRHPAAIERSRYYTQLQPWLRLFDIQSLHVVLFEDLVSDAHAASRGIFEFLNVDAAAGQAIPEQAVNASFAPRFPRLYAGAKSLSRRLYASDHARVVATLKRTRLARALRSDGHAIGHEVDGSERRWLGAQLRDDADKLAELLDLDLAARWRSLYREPQQDPT